MTTTAARAPWHLWCALAACIVSTAISVHAAWNADTLPVTLVYAAMAALTAVIAVWGCRVVAAYRRDAADLDAILGAVITYCPDNADDTSRRPEGVTIHHPDGTTTVCELAYVGIEDGLHTWAAATPYRPGRDQVTIEMLPAHSCVRFLIPDTGLRDTDSTNTREDPREPPPPHRRHL